MTISVKNVSKSSGDMVGLRNVGFTATDGQIVAMLGPRASGKSCLITCLSGLTTPDAGTIVIDEQSISETDARQRIGVVFNQSSLDDELSVNENIALYARLYGLTDAARQSMMEVLAAELDLDDWLDRRVGELSVSQKRRADIARALVHAPQVVLLDEPFAGLEPHEADLVWRTLLTCQSLSMTVIFTTDEPSRAKLANSVGLMIEGQLVALGGPADLIAANCPPTLRLTLDDPRAAQEDLANIGLDLPEPAANGDVIWPIESPGLARDIVSVLGDHVLGFDYHTGTLADVLDIAIESQPDADAGVASASVVEQTDAGTGIVDGGAIGVDDGIDEADAGVWAHEDDMTTHDNDSEADTWTDDTTGDTSGGVGDELAVDGVEARQIVTQAAPTQGAPIHDGLNAALADEDEDDWEMESTVVASAQATALTDAERLGTTGGDAEQLTSMGGDDEWLPADDLGDEVDRVISLNDNDMADEALDDEAIWDVEPLSDREATDQRETMDQSAPGSSQATAWDQDESEFMDEAATGTEDLIDIRDPADVAPRAARHRPAPQPHAATPSPESQSVATPVPADQTATASDSPDQTAAAPGSLGQPADEPVSPDHTGATLGSLEPATMGLTSDDTPGHPDDQDQALDSTAADAWQSDDEWETEHWTHGRSFSDTGRSFDTRRPLADDALVASEFAEFVGADEVYEDMPLPPQLRSPQPTTAEAATAQFPAFQPSGDAGTPSSGALHASPRDRAGIEVDEAASSMYPQTSGDLDWPDDKEADTSADVRLDDIASHSQTARPAGSTGRPGVADGVTPPRLDGNDENPLAPGGQTSAADQTPDADQYDTDQQIPRDNQFDATDQQISRDNRTVRVGQTDVTGQFDDADQLDGTGQTEWSLPPEGMSDSTGGSTVPTRHDPGQATGSLEPDQPPTSAGPIAISGATTGDQTDSMSTYDHAESPYWSDPTGTHPNPSGSVLLPPLFDENVELDQLAAVSQLVKDAILKDALPSFDEQFPPGSLPITPEDDLGEKLDADDTQREALWRAELSRPIDETLAHQARIKLAVEKRIREARRRRDAHVKDGE